MSFCRRKGLSRRQHHCPGRLGLARLRTGRALLIQPQQVPRHRLLPEIEQREPVPWVGTGLCIAAWQRLDEAARVDGSGLVQVGLEAGEGVADALGAAEDGGGVGGAAVFQFEQVRQLLQA